MQKKLERNYGRPQISHQISFSGSQQRCLLERGVGKAAQSLEFSPNLTIKKQNETGTHTHDAPA